MGNQLLPPWAINLIESYGWESLAVVCVIAATHTVKVVAEYWYPVATETANRWRAFSALASVLFGLLAGLVLWLNGWPWALMPAMAFLPGLVWLLLRGILPERIKARLLTPTDRKYRRKEAP